MGFILYRRRRSTTRTVVSNEAEPAVASMDVELASEVPAEDRGSLETSSQVKPYAGGKVVEPIVGHDVIAHLLVKAVKIPHLGAVYGSLLGFDGSEFYFCDMPRFQEKARRTFKELLYCSPDTILIGIRRKGKVILNPDDELVPDPTDELVVIAEDDSLITFECSVRNCDVIIFVRKVQKSPPTYPHTFLAPTEPPCAILITFAPQFVSRTTPTTSPTASRRATLLHTCSQFRRTTAPLSTAVGCTRARTLASTPR